MLYVGDVNFKAAINWNLRLQWLNLQHSSKFSFFTIYLKLAAKRKYLSKYTINIPYGSSKSSILYSLDTKTIKKNQTQLFYEIQELRLIPRREDSRKGTVIRQSRLNCPEISERSFYWYFYRIFKRRQRVKYFDIVRKKLPCFWNLVW